MNLDRTREKTSHLACNHIRHISIGTILGSHIIIFNNADLVERTIIGDSFCFSKIVLRAPTAEKRYLHKTQYICTIFAVEQHKYLLIWILTRILKILRVTLQGFVNLITTEDDDQNATIENITKITDHRIMRLFQDTAMKEILNVVYASDCIGSIFFVQTTIVVKQVPFLSLQHENLELLKGGTFAVPVIWKHVAHFDA
ncbi:hypothetical protein ACJX0J_027288, partial [Zea mays]